MIENIEFKKLPSQSSPVSSACILQGEICVPMTVTPSRMLLGAVLSLGHG